MKSMKMKSMAMKKTMKKIDEEEGVLQALPPGCRVEGQGPQVSRWSEEEQPDEVEEGQDRFGQEVGPGQEVQVDRCRDQGSQGAGRQGLRCDQEGQRSVQEGEVLLQVNA